MEQNHELPPSFQKTERCFYVCGGGCGRVAFRHTYFSQRTFSCVLPISPVSCETSSCAIARRRTAWLLMCPNQSLNTWPQKRRRTLMRFLAASPKMALSTTKGRIITVVTQSANGSKRRTRNTDTSCGRLTFKRSETG